MIPPALKEQIQKLKAEGKADDIVKLELINSGWPKNLVEQAFSQMVTSEYLSPNTVQPAQPTVPNQQEANPVQVQATPQPAVQSPQVYSSTPQQTAIPSASSGQGGTKDKLTSYFVAILTGEKKFRVFLVGIIIGIIACIQPSYFLFRHGLPFLEDIESRVQMVVEEVFPEELEITIKDGIASTNVNEPYYLTVSQNTLTNLLKVEEENVPQSKARILAIDTEGKIEDFNKHQSAAFLTSQNITYYEEGELKIQDLSSIPDMVVNQEFIEEKIDEFNEGGKMVKLARNLIYLSPAFLTVMYYITFILSVLFGAFIIWLINKILQANIKFSRLFALTGVLYVIPVILLTIISAIEFLSIFHSWFDTALDVAVYSAGYVIILKYKREVGGA